MSKTIQRIKKTDLHILKSLLQTSFGEAFDLQDELDYFDEMPHHSWFYLKQHDQPVGFIRCFQISNNLYQIELFAFPSNERLEHIKDLIMHFQENNCLGKNAQIRFDIQENQKGILQLLEEIFPSAQIKRFLYMQKILYSSKNLVDTCNTNIDEFFTQVANVLNVLKQYPIDYLSLLYSDERLYVYCESEKPLAALHIEPKANSVCEVITLATDSSRLRQGYATKLLKAFFIWAHPRFDKVELKVEEQNTAAIKLYQSLGFETIPEQIEQWWYTSTNKTK